MALGRPGLRSVDSEHVERAIEPRKPLVEGADAVRRCGGSTEALYWPGATVPPGSENVAGVQGSIQEPGRSHRFRRRRAGRAHRCNKVQACRRGARPPARDRSRRVQSGTAEQKENEAERDGRWEVGAS